MPFLFQGGTQDSSAGVAFSHGTVNDPSKDTLSVGRRFPGARDSSRCTTQRCLVHREAEECGHRISFARGVR